MEHIGKSAERSGNPITVFEEIRARIEMAGFINVHDKVLKLPCGDWPKHPVHKDFGIFNKAHYSANKTRMEHGK